MQVERHVVTCFLVHQGRLLLLQRSDKVTAYQGCWAAVSGTVRDEPLSQAYREILEEVGLNPPQLALLKRGEPVEVNDRRRQMRWLVHPFLFEVADPDAIRLSWEHSTHQWYLPQELQGVTTVPMLERALERVWSDWRPAPSAASEEPPARVRLPSNRSLLRDDVGPVTEVQFSPDQERGTDDAIPVGIRVRVQKADPAGSGSGAPASVIPVRDRPPSLSGPKLVEDEQLAPALEALRQDRLSGAISLLRQAVELLPLVGLRSAATDAPAWLNDLRLVARELAAARPAQGGIVHGLARLFYAVQFDLARLEAREVRQAALEQACADLLDQLQEELSLLAEHVEGLLLPGATVMSVGYNIPVVESLVRARQLGLNLLVPEGRPRLEGRRLARAALGLGRQVTLIPDAAVAFHMRQVDLVLLGAEALLEDGTVVARMGSHLMALAARGRQVPVYALAPSVCLELRAEAHASLTLEEGQAEEVWDEAPEGLYVRNLLLETVPPGLISGVVTEEGLLEPLALGWEVRARGHLLEALEGE